MKLGGIVQICYPKVELSRPLCFVNCFFKIRCIFYTSCIFKCVLSLKNI